MALIKKEHTIEPTVSFSQIAAIAEGWMFDFSFLSLCRYFKEQKFDEFNNALLILKAITEGTFFSSNDQIQKRTISSLLARVMHGQLLDTQFEDNDRVMPLMSASLIWSNMKDTVADEHMFESIANLLIIQSVAVCMEKDQKAKASFALEWLEEKHEIPQNLRVKLSAILTKGDVHHPFLLNFSYSRLLEMIHTYLDAFQGENPPDFLLKAATKVALSSREKGKDSLAMEEALSGTNKSIQGSMQKRKNSSSLRKKKRLYGKTSELLEPNSFKPLVIIQQLSLKDDPALPQTSQNNTRGIKKTRKKWTSELDRKLVKGVRRHGIGKWSRILLENDFEGRTGTMLKDRWRILQRELS